MEFKRKQFTIAGADFSAPDPLSSASFAKLKQESTPLLRKIGLTDEQIADTTQYMRGLISVLSQLPYDATLLILRSVLRPESGVSIEDAYEYDSDGGANKVIGFFSESLIALTTPDQTSAEHSPNTKKVTRRRKQ